jgi:hypothetical protein
MQDRIGQKQNLDCLARAGGNGDGLPGHEHRDGVRQRTRRSGATDPVDELY